MMLHRHFDRIENPKAKSVPNYAELTKGMKRLGKNKKVAVYSGSRMLYDDMIPAIKSLLINSDVDKIYLFIQDDEFPYELPKEVETINVSGQTIFDKRSPNMQSQFTYMAMMRATLAYMFPNMDRVLSLDIDTIVERDISDIWDLPIDEYYLAGVNELYFSNPHRKYVNAGVILYNLKKLRDGKAEEVIKYLNRFGCNFLEQDAFNDLCQNQILLMPPEYNSTKFTPKTDEPRIIHYAGLKNWSNEPLMGKYRNIPWDEIAQLRKEKYGK